eukprot:1526637-Prymnesium_polylepis.1
MRFGCSLKRSIRDRRFFGAACNLRVIGDCCVSSLDCACCVGRELAIDDGRADCAGVVGLRMTIEQVAAEEAAAERAAAEQGAAEEGSSTNLGPASVLFMGKFTTAAVLVYSAKPL